MRSFLAQTLPSEESCWMFEDEEGRRQGPHSIAELCYWHHSSYLHDLVMVRVDKSCHLVCFSLLICTTTKEILWALMLQHNLDNICAIVDFLDSHTTSLVCPKCT